MTLFTHIALLATVAFVAWLLSAHSRRIAESPRKDLIQRGIRCFITLLLAEAGVQILSRDATGIGFIYFLIIVVGPTTLLWGGAVSEILAVTFNWLVDPEDNRKFDPEERSRALDTVAALIRDGRNQEAIQLCLELKKSNDASAMAMDTILEQLGAPQKSASQIKPINQAAQSRREGKLQEAELILKSLLFKNPANVEAAMLLMRIYAEDLKQGNEARQVLESLKKQKYISKGHIEFAERSIYEWLNPQKEKAPEEQLPVSIEELLAQRYFGTATEILEQQIKEQPQNFELHMKLAEAQCRHCNNFKEAEKIVRRMESGGHFSKAQVEKAKSKLQEWRALPLRN